MVDRYDLSRATPQYAWPLLVELARAGLAALRQASSGRDELQRGRAAALLERLRIIAERLATFGPVQQAYQLTFTAQDQTGSLLRAETGSMVSTSARSAWDETAAAWEALGQPYQTAIALLRAAEAALADGDRETAAERLRRAAPLSDRLGAGPLSDEIASLARRARIALAAGTAEPARLGLTDARVRGAPPGRSRAGATARSRPSCSSPRRPPACTYPTSSRNSASAAAGKLPPGRTTATCSIRHNRSPDQGDCAAGTGGIRECCRAPRPGSLIRLPRSPAARSWPTL